MNELEYIKNVELLNSWAKAYYVDDNPIATDEEYDELYHRVLEFEKNNPDKILSYSPTQRVGDKISDGFEKLPHIARMWSMEDIFDEADLKAWLKRGDKENLEFFCEPKFDGASLNLTYNNGTLISASTRGDGIIGEDVTQNARVINSIPLKINYDKLIEIRGEVVISKQEFDKINEKQARMGEKLFSNPRNLASGTLRQLDSSVVKSRNLLFIPWDIGENSLNFKKHSEIMEFIRSLGFLQDGFCKVVSGADEILKTYNDLHNIRDDKPILMDGMVIRINDTRVCNNLGYTIKFPRFMVAYKFKAIQKITKLQGIKLQVGRSGVITPVAILDPVNIDGAIVKNATLHNFDEIKRLGIKIFDFISVIRSGDVIPKVTDVLIDRRSGDELEITRPKICPECGGELLDEGVFIKCQNLNCPARVVNGIIHFASKKCMNIDGLGVKIVELLYKMNKISNIIDIYNLKYEDLSDLEGFKDKKINNLLNAINNSKGISLDKFINSLGIEHIGEVAAKKIATIFGNDWVKISLDDLLSIDGFGKEMSSALINFIKTNEEFIKKLSDIIKPQALKIDIKNNKFKDKTIVITGTLNKNREEIKDYLFKLGAKVSSSISSKTDYLLCGSNAGSKLQKAKDLGINIISEDEIYEI